MNFSLHQQDFISAPHSVLLLSMAFTSYCELLQENHALAALG